MSNETTNENPASAEPADPTAKAEGRAPETAEGSNGDSLLAQLQSDLERFRDLALRSQADFDNFRKRAIREKEEAVKYANASLLERLIPIVDNFELGLAAARGSADGGAIILGLDMVGKQLTDFLTQCGVEAVSAEGQKFDPNQHEAFMQEESATIPEGNVVRQLRKGYRLKDRLLRPAAVVVSKGAPAAQG